MRLRKFRVQSYRNIEDSGWISTTDVTAFVGQNEAGKSNLFEALYCLNPYVEGATYNADEDWPVDDWNGRADAKGTLVCTAKFELSEGEIRTLFQHAAVTENIGEIVEAKDAESDTSAIVDLPAAATIRLWKNYGYGTGFQIESEDAARLDEKRVTEWAKKNVPKFVLIHDYEMSGAQIELDQLKQRRDQAGVGNEHTLSNEDQTILQILELAQINLDDFLTKGDTQSGRTVRSLDKRSASRYLSQQFSKLWSQKAVEFNIDIDGPTLNIFAQDEAVGMPVRLNRRSTGFRWYVSFAWKFTHASRGKYADCVLLLEEPGIHLHYSGQRDLLSVFEDLSKTNSVLYTTHLASMVDQSHPERIRIVESRDHHLSLTHGVVSSQPGPMAVIEMSLQA